MDASQLQPGDILACYGRDKVSRLISLWTGSLRRPSELRLGPSHVAICVEHPERGLIVVESTSVCAHKCLFRRMRVSGVQAHYPERRITDYTSTGGRVEVWRPNLYWSFSAVESMLLWETLRKHFDPPRQTRYDLRGAITSGTRVLCKVLSWLETDLERVFCSELIAAALMRLDRLPLDNATRYNPGRLLRTLYRINVYQHMGPVTVAFRTISNEQVVPIHIGRGDAA